jgi:hypothetical protein
MNRGVEGVELKAADGWCCGGAFARPEGHLLASGVV